MHRYAFEISILICYLCQKLGDADFFVLRYQFQANGRVTLCIADSAQGNVVNLVQFSLFHLA